MNDEEQIRDLVRRWHEASRAGETQAVLDLMTEDVVFLTPGREPMDKAEFAALSTPPPGTPRPSLAVEQEIREVQVEGNLAFLWSRLAVAMTPPGAAAPNERRGHTLTIFRKVDGRWLLARDANLLVPAPGSAAKGSA